MESCAFPPMRSKATPSEGGDLPVAGFDTHLDGFTLCLMSRGEVLSTARAPASRSALREEARRLRGCRAAAEGCPTAHPLVWELRRLGVDAGLVNPHKVRNLRKGFFKDCKNDRIDAEAVATLVDRMREKPRDPGDGELRTLARHHHSLTERLVQVKQRAWWILYQLNTNYRKCFSDVFCKTSRRLLSRHTPQELEEMPLPRLEEALREANPRYGPERARLRARLIRDLLRDGLRGNPGPGAVAVLRDLLREMESLEERISETLSLLVRLAGERRGEELSLLRTIPGVTAERAALILAELGDVGRFPTVDKVVAYAGLDPKVRESGRWRGRRKLSKRGSPALRAALYRTAMGARLSNPVIGAEYKRMRSRGKSHKEALVAASRKLLKIIYAVLRDKKPFHTPENTKNTTKKS